MRRVHTPTVLSRSCLRTRTAHIFPIPQPSGETGIRADGISRVGKPPWCVTRLRKQARGSQLVPGGVNRLEIYEFYLAIGKSCLRKSDGESTETRFRKLQPSLSSDASGYAKSLTGTRRQKVCVGNIGPF